MRCTAIACNVGVVGWRQSSWRHSVCSVCEGCAQRSGPACGRTSGAASINVSGNSVPSIDVIRSCRCRWSAWLTAHACKHMHADNTPRSLHEAFAFCRPWIGSKTVCMVVFGQRPLRLCRKLAWLVMHFGIEEQPLGFM